MQRRLVAENDLTYEKAIELAKSMEAAENGSQAISSDVKQTDTTTPLVHFTLSTATRQACRRLVVDLGGHGGAMPPPKILKNAILIDFD